MLRIIPNVSAQGAKSYYSTSDYYLAGGDGQELAGVWKGQGAERLGLSGMIDRADWDALCDNRNPETGKALTPRQKDNRRVGYDFNFHVPKSVSVLYALTRDDRILDAFRESVDETMRDIESEMRTRVRLNDARGDRVTGNMAWGEFIHFTSRPVDGVPDPHLHAHCFVFNATWDDKESRWKAGEFGSLKRDASYFEAGFHSRLARRMMELGLDVERNRKAWEIAGISKAAIDVFSRRTAQIEKLAKEKGVTDPHEKAELGAKTRSRKQKNLSFEQLQELWRSQLPQEDADAVNRVAGRIGGPALREDAKAAREAVDYAAGHLFERSAVVPERKLLAEAIKRGVGSASKESVEQAVCEAGFVTAERGGRRLVTTREVLAEETRMLKFARDGRGACPKLGGADEREHVFRNKDLNDGQRRAVLHVLGSRDRVMLIRGAAGVGKTWSMREAIDAIEVTGKRVFTFAPSADASRGVLREEAKFEDADTVARLLVDEKMQEAARGQVLWIDEASLLGNRTMGQVFDLAERIDARVILQGDRRQHGSVARGAALRLLEEEAGLVPAEIREIKRQSGDYRYAVQALSEGRIESAFKQLDDLKWIHELPEDQDRYGRLASDYVDAVRKGERVLVVSPTHREGEHVTQEIRHALRAGGRLGTDERTFTTLTNLNLTEAQRSDAANLENSDVLAFHQNAKGYRKGQRVSVEAGKEDLPLDQAARFQVFRRGALALAPGDVIRVTQNGTTLDGHTLNNGAIYAVKRFDREGDLVLNNGWTISKDWGHITQGYVVTSHASQGKSPDRVLVAQSADSLGASSLQQFYVSVSRGRHGCAIYTDDKAALLEAVAQSDDRLTATEFVAGKDLEEHGRRIQRMKAMERADADGTSDRQRNRDREMVLG